MWRQLPTLAIVTIVALLIWVFAEAETLRQRELPVDLAFQPEAPSSMLVDVREWGGTLSGRLARAQVVMEGSVGGMEEVERLFRRPVALYGEAGGMPTEPGEHVVDLRAVLREHPEIRRRGVTIAKVDPPSMLVSVDTLIEREVGVRVEVGALELDGVPEVKPARVKVRLPAGQAGLMGENAYAIAQLDAATLQRLIPARKESVAGVPLRLPGVLGVSTRATLEPSQADVTLTVRQREARTIVASVPVHVQLAASEQADWEIRIDQKDQFLTDVKVSGPSDLIKQIEDKRLAVVAILALSFNELEGGKVTAKEVAFSSMPASLRFDAANKTVGFTAVRRNPGANGGGARPGGS